MGSSGGVPMIGPAQGFFPMGPQLSQQSMQPWDMGPIGERMGLSSFPGGPPAQPAAPPAQPQGVLDMLGLKSSTSHRPSGWTGGSNR